MIISEQSKPDSWLPIAHMHILTIQEEQDYKTCQLQIPASYKYIQIITIKSYLFNKEGKLPHA